MPIRTGPGGSRPSGSRARLSARPRASAPTLRAGVYKLGLQPGRDGLLCVPAAALETVAPPLTVTLHGAGGTAEGGLDFFTAAAESAGVILLSPESRAQPWDSILDRFGPD